jgi:hypothetical protein
VDGIKNWTLLNPKPFNLSSAWNGVVAFVTQNVTMPNVSSVPTEYQGLTYPRYKAPHVPNQPNCAQAPANLPGNLDDQSVYGCINEKTCPDGCVEGQPSMHNPGPSFSNTTHSVNLVRIHKATVHFTCVRALLILQRERTERNAHETQRHTYTLARVLMKPKPGNAFNQKDTFRNNIMNGDYAENVTGVWQVFQTGTTGLRSMDLKGTNGPNPSSLTFRGVTDNDMLDMPGQLRDWNANCIGKPDMQCV